jgi:diaminopropionate ammonia-lyase
MVAAVDLGVTPVAAGHDDRLTARSSSAMVSLRRSPGSRPLDVHVNPFRGLGFPPVAGMAQGRVRTDPSGVQQLLERCPAAGPTPLLTPRSLSRQMEVAQLHLKDERSRMGLGSFKALGAGHVIARMAVDRLGGAGPTVDDAVLASALRGTVFACASAGNHGLSVAANAAVFGATARIYLSEAVPEAFAQRLRRRGATVCRAGHDYEASMAAAADADADDWILLSDSSWPGYVDMPIMVMEGYLVIGAEIVAALGRPATHLLVQAGVGGLAAALAALLRARWGEAPVIVVVEPDRAPALQASIRACRPVSAPGPASSMGRLDCKEPSHVALGELARSADHFVTVTDEEVEATVALLGRHGIETTPSGAAGVAALHHAGRHRDALGLDRDSRVVTLITEGPEAAA